MLCCIGRADWQGCWSALFLWPSPDWEAWIGFAEPATPWHSSSKLGSAHGSIAAFGLRASSVADVNKVGTSLITSRRVIFVPNTEIKEELARTSINITCYDRNGEVVKRVTSSDEGNVEDPEDDSSTGSEQGNGGGTTDNGSTGGGSGNGSTSSPQDGNGDEG